MMWWPKPKVIETQANFLAGVARQHQRRQTQRPDRISDPLSHLGASFHEYCWTTLLWRQLKASQYFYFLKESLNLHLLKCFSISANSQSRDVHRIVLLLLFHSSGELMQFSAMFRGKAAIIIVGLSRYFKSKIVLGCSSKQKKKYWWLYKTTSLRPSRNFCLAAVENGLNLHLCI